MPRRGESFLLLEQAVTVDSNEIDALVAKIGETLQFQRIPNGSSGGATKQQHHNEQQQYYHHHPQQPSPRGSAKCGMCCIDRLKTPSRNKPYEVPARIRDPGQAATATTNNKSKTMRPAYELDAQQKLEQLLSSGNLIKEAVRRLRIDHDYSPLYMEKIPL